MGKTLLPAIDPAAAASAGNLLFISVLWHTSAPRNSPPEFQSQPQHWVPQPLDCRGQRQSSLRAPERCSGLPLIRHVPVQTLRLPDDPQSHR